jgi:hypothetical protein
MSAPTPPPAAPTPPPAGPPSFNVGSWNIFDKIAVGAGAVVFLFSFLKSYVTVSLSAYGLSGSGLGVSAWHSYAVLGLLMMFAAVALVVVSKMDASALPNSVPWPLINGIIAAIGVFLVLLRGLTWSASYSNYGVGASVGIGWSGWIVILAGVVLASATIIPLTTYKSKVEEKLTNLGGGSGS